MAFEILGLLDDPQAWFSKNNKVLPKLSAGGLSTLIETAYPELKGSRDFYSLLGKDLYAKGLIGMDHFNSMMNRSGSFASRTTPLGQEFLKYISFKA